MSESNPHPLGVVPVQRFTSEEPLELRSGDVLPTFTLEYETLGRLSPEKDNVVLVCHALSGDAHVAGLNSRNGRPGWWEEAVGPDKAIDTDRHFVVCANVLGGCQGSTGPSSLNPATGKPWGIDFPVITIADMVEAQERLLDHLGIRKLHAVVGGSMGGMQVLQWMVSYPNRARNAIVIATCARHTPQQIAFNEVGRRAITSDPNWRGGHYDESTSPTLGLAIARMIGHITYLSEAAMFEKFGRRIRQFPLEKFEPAFEVETYLSHQGERFVERFDANSYLFITKAIDTFDLLSGGQALHEVLARWKGRTLLVSFTSDWLYPPAQVREIADAIRRSQGDATYCEIETGGGHDSFLLRNPQQSALISGFLGSPDAFKDNGGTWIP